MTDLFESSDSIRSGKPLKYAQSVTFAEPLDLELGGRLSRVTVAFETYGNLNARRDNAVLVCHALSGDSHVARHDDADDPGWWDVLIGPGKGIDTDRYFVICPNSLGGCRGSTGPNSINPETGRRYGTDFPSITVGDIVEAQRRLIDHLGQPSFCAPWWADRSADMPRWFGPRPIPSASPAPSRWLPPHGSPARRWPSMSSDATPFSPIPSIATVNTTSRAKVR